jgi:hypothetical protein
MVVVGRRALYKNAPDLSAYNEVREDFDRNNQIRVFSYESHFESMRSGLKS